MTETRGSHRLHAEKNVRRHAILAAIPDRPHQPIDPLQTPKGSPDLLRRGGDQTPLQSLDR